MNDTVDPASEPAAADVYAAAAAFCSTLLRFERIEQKRDPEAPTFTHEAIIRILESAGLGDRPKENAR